MFANLTYRKGLTPRIQKKKKTSKLNHKKYTVQLENEQRNWTETSLDTIPNKRMKDVQHH